MKALTREDLLYILQSVFKISEQEKNAVQINTDGLYVKDYSNDLNVLNEDYTTHINPNIKDILSKLKENEEGLLTYNDSLIGIKISKKENNGINIEPDGLYIQNSVEHINDNDIHVTKEDKEKWDNSIELANEFTKKQINNLTIYDVKIVSKLPEPIQIPIEGSEQEFATINPSSNTLYLLENDSDCPEECEYTLYMYIKDKWCKLGITNYTLNKYVLKNDIKEVVNNSHMHDNANILNNFTENDKGELLYSNIPIREINISDKEDNAVIFIDGKIYVRDFDKEIKSLKTGGFLKYNLYNDEINNSGTYELNDSIDSYSLILVEYYYKSNDLPGCAKTAVIDTDTLNHLYSKNIDYMLEYSHGMLTSNTKIRINKNKLLVNYYNNISIYKITGIKSS